MIKVKEVIVVEGRYDKNTLSQVFDAVIIETDGFGIFSRKDKLDLLRRMAEKRGLIVLTDPDGAGQVIRGYISSAIPPALVRHAYVPEIYGREKRKISPSKEGKLGVEGMEPSVLIDALRRAGATLDGETSPEHSERITKADMYRLGLSGGTGSAERRLELKKKLSLPSALSSNALLDVLNALYSRSEFLALWENE